MKLPLLKIAIVLVVLGVLAVFVLRGLNLKKLIDDGMAVIRGAGPWAFFGAMAILPSFGAPLLAFTIPAGEAFAGQFTIGGVIAICFGVIAFNLALTYWLARYAFRPLLTGLVKRAGYDIPRVTPKNALSVALLVRLVPGPPYALQGYLLGLAEVPFRMFMVVSWLCVAPWAVGAIILGQGILNGNFKLVAIGIGVLAVVIVGVQLLRNKYAKPAQ